MKSIEAILLRICRSIAFRLRRRQRARELSSTPAGLAGIAADESIELLRMLASRPPRVIYDVGANRGQWTVLARSVFPRARIEAFEPLPMHCAVFAQQTASLPDVRLHQIALGAAAAVLPMDLTSFSDSASLLSPTPTMAEIYHVQSGAKVDVSVVRLDDWVREHALPQPELIKLDLQGYELDALRGSAECLRHCAAVIIELSFREFYQNQPRPGVVISHLEAAGFSLISLAPTVEPGRRLDQLDALFVRQT